MCVRQNRNALGAEFDRGHLAEAHERWGDRDCRSMQRVRHQGVAGVLFVPRFFLFEDPRTNEYGILEYYDE
jgi:hypothetical protein